ncbi:MAG: hypothetical protein RIS90_3235 [Pseudomonadota bacterium]|jgi:hypothetical protein
MDPDDGKPLAPEGVAAAQGPLPEVEPSPPVGELSFVRPVRTEAVEEQPVLLAALASLAFTLLLVLLLQIVLHERNTLAAAQPGLTTLLSRLCQPLNCTVSPVQKIEAVVIDSSSFSRVQDVNFRLAVVLKNTAPVAVAAPAIELTLTDAQDQTLLRRVILPDELQGTADALAPEVEWSAAVNAVLSPEIATAVAGYRMVAFYP